MSYFNEFEIECECPDGDYCKGYIRKNTPPDPLDEDNDYKKCECVCHKTDEDLKAEYESQEETSWEASRDMGRIQ